MRFTGQDYSRPASSIALLLTQIQNFIRRALIQINMVRQNFFLTKHTSVHFLPYVNYHASKAPYWLMNANIRLTCPIMPSSLQY